MSEKKNQPFNPEAQIEAAKSEIFSSLKTKLTEGTFYPKNGDCPAEYVAIVPELGQFATATTNANSVQNPTEIHLFRHNAATRIAAEYWLTPSGIEAQHSAFDENHDPYIIDERHVLNPEELIELHTELFPDSLVY